MKMKRRNLQLWVIISMLMFVIAIGQTEYSDYSADFFADDVAHLNPANTTAFSKIPYPKFASISSDAFVAVWATYEGTSSEVFARVFSIVDDETDGLTHQSTEFQVNAYTTNAQDMPSVTALYGENNTMINRFAIIWESSWQDGSYDGIYCRLFDHWESYNSDTNEFESGITSHDLDVTTEWKVNQYNESYQRFPAIVALYDTQEYVVSWISYNQQTTNDGSTTRYDIYARVYDNDGNPKTNEFSVHDTSDDWEYLPRLSPFRINWEIECNSYDECKEKESSLNLNNKECFNSTTLNRDIDLSYFLVTWTVDNTILVNILSNKGKSCLSNNDQIIGNEYMIKTWETQGENDNSWEHKRSDIINLWENYFLVTWESDKHNNTNYDDEIQAAIYYYDIYNNSLELMKYIRPVNQYQSDYTVTSTYPRVHLIDLQGCKTCKDRVYNPSAESDSDSTDSDDDSIDDSDSDSATDDDDMTALVQICWQTYEWGSGISSKLDIFCNWISIELKTVSDNTNNYAQSYNGYYIDYEFLYTDSDFLISDYTDTSGDQFAMYPTIASFYRPIQSRGTLLSINNDDTNSYLPEFYSIVGWQTSYQSTSNSYEIYGRVLSIGNIDNNKPWWHHLHSSHPIVIVIIIVGILCCIICLCGFLINRHKKKQRKKQGLTNLRHETEIANENANITKTTTKHSTNSGRMKEKLSNVMAGLTGTSKVKAHRIEDLREHSIESRSKSISDNDNNRKKIHNDNAGTMLGEENIELGETVIRYDQTNKLQNDKHYGNGVHGDETQSDGSASGSESDQVSLEAPEKIDVAVVEV